MLDGFWVDLLKRAHILPAAFAQHEKSTGAAAIVIFAENWSLGIGIFNKFL